MKHKDAENAETLLHPLFERASDWTVRIIGAAIEVHREIGPGLLESVYERCLARELEIAGIPFAEQLSIPLRYKGLETQEPFRCDFLVDSCLIIEAKAVQEILPIHRAQVLTYMRLLDVPLGLILNFHAPVLKEGIERLILKGADGSASSASPCSN